ncbi:MAG: cyclic nucleotide-binding domain-containing protein [bacterium]
MDFIQQPYMMAFWLGAFTALSLPLGAMLGIWLKPPTRIVAAIMAFGAGNLLAALTLELIEPAFNRSGFNPIAIGCILGALIFVGLNQMLESSGGYKRKMSTLISYMKAKKRKQMHDIIDKLSQVDILRMLPPEEMHRIIPAVEDRTFKTGNIIFRQEDPGASLYIIENGRVRVSANGKEVSELGPGETFGEMALLWHGPRTATVEALSDVALWEIHREDFEELLKASSKLHDEVSKLAEKRKAGLELITGVSAEDWSKTAKQRLNEEDVRPSAVEMAHAIKNEQGGGAALSMWLGIFLDGIPESLVIGASMIGAAVSPALIGGLFFANLPEAMSSGTMMKKQGKSTGKIFWMWTSLMIITGLGALIGNIAFVGVGHSTHSLVEGLAAGAMLAMIAQTMLPEAFEQGGWLVGVLTVVGFLSALLFRALGEASEHHQTLLPLIQTVFGV